ncbi:hypothetical protein [Labrys monachus]|uniref:TPR repeat protein n=1 Tax=Labrys monachus TaxID=217067 RepID=A0ABU0FD46_9HYPH|nr:hypothetical protein [Labrys monachus]MDQ0392466.1 TPR repeat protein [Labrys monachus]
MIGHRVFLLNWLALAALLLAPSTRRSQQDDALHATLAKRPAWLFHQRSCPADAFGTQPDLALDSDVDCKADQATCLLQCQVGDAFSCYWLAVELQREDPRKRRTDDYNALFHRACELGTPSGCTNRAAAMMDDGPASARCVTRSFEIACKAHDPWGCSMYALELYRGEGTARDLSAAKAALADSCLNGDIDPACRAAKRLRLEIEHGPIESH